MKRYLASLTVSLLFSSQAIAALTGGQGNATIIGPMVLGHCVMSGGATLLKDAGAACGGGGGGSGTVTSVSGVTSAGVAVSVATPTTTPAITVTLGNITPSSVNATGLILGSNLSGTNTGDQTITLTGAVTGSGTGSFATSLGSFSSASLAGAITDETGTGSAVFGTNPVFTTPLTIQDATDTTKKGTFVMSGITTATTVNYTFPNATGSLATIANLNQIFSGPTTFSASNVVVGSAPTTSNYGLGTGANTSGVTKTITIGTSGLSGSTTTIGIGSAVSGALGGITLNQATTTPAQITSTLATGTSPFVVASTTRVSNLNSATAGTADTTNALQSATTTVNVSSATAPTTGQVLKATSGTAATWQTIATGGTIASTTNLLIGDGSGNALAAGAGNITSTSANAFTVGPNGATNPAFAVDGSVASAATGFSIQGQAAGSGSKLQATSSATDEDAYFIAKGAGAIRLNGGSSLFFDSSSFGGNIFMRLAGNSVWFSNAFRQNWFLPLGSGTASDTRYLFTGPDDSGSAATASTELLAFYTNMGQTRQHATGTITTQRDVRVTGSTHTFVAASTITTAAAFAVDGASIAGTNASITNSASIYTPGVAVGSGVTNSYGILANPNTGATNNFAAGFGGNVDFQGNSIINAKVLGGGTTAAFNATSNTTLAIITGTSNNVVASGVYAFTATIRTTAPTAGGIKVQMGGTATATNYNATVFNYAATVLTITSSAAYGTPDFSSATATAETLVISGTVTINAAGTFGIQFAQNTSNATSSTVAAGATLVLNRIS